MLKRSLIVAATLLGGASYAAPPRAARIDAACARHMACGCEMTDCAATYRQSEVPGGVFACIASLECAALCAPDAGQPGSVAAQKCFSEAALMAAMAEEAGEAAPIAEPPPEAPPEIAVDPPVEPPVEPTAPAEVLPLVAAGSLEALIRQSCQHGFECGCPKMSQAECEARGMAEGSAGGPELFTCLIGLDCAAMCDPKAGEPGTVAYSRCVGPAIERINAAAAAGAAERAAGHRLRMGIINNYPTGRAPRKRIYDQNGNFLREE
ncbi:MAG: hypothetical protein R3F60_15975 [bacterium]